MCSYVFYAYVTWMIIVNVIVYDLAVDGAPHKDLHSLNHELQDRGFQTLASDDDFDRSFTCTTCGVKLTYQDRAKAMWLLKRHSSENSHQVKAGWYLDANNNVLASKPRGKSRLVNCLTSQNGMKRQKTIYHWKANRLENLKIIFFTVTPLPQMLTQITPHYSADNGLTHCVRLFQYSYWFSRKSI